MSPHENGVTEMLRGASDDLTPDVDRLVVGGIARGRSRQRRARIGTTVASLAVIGVVGGLAAVVPLLGPSDRASEPGIATDGGVVASESPTPEPTTTPTVPAVQASLAVRAVDIPATVATLLDREDVSSPLRGEPNNPHESAEQRVVHFRIDGMVTSVYIDRSEPTAAVDPAQGVVWDWWGPDPGRPIQASGVSVWRAGYSVAVTAYNSVDRHDESSVKQAEPVLTVEQMLTVAKSEVWFE